MPADARSRLLQLARDLLAQATGRPPDSFTVDLRAADGSTAMRFEPLPGEFGPADAPDLSDLHRAILRVLTNEPQSVKVLARLTGYSYSPRFRAGVADLVRRGLAVRLPDGIKRAG